MTVKLRVTLTFDYEANPAGYDDSDPIKMAEVDHRGFCDDPDMLMRMFDQQGGKLTVEPVPADLWAVDVNDGVDCRPMADKATAEKFVQRRSGKPGITLKVIRWPGTAAGRANILALESALGEP